MAQQILNNSETGLAIRNKINGNFTELYGSGITSRQEFNVLDYGAVGNGTVDCTTAFQNAINAARAVNGTVIIPPANDGSHYRITSTVNIHPASGAQIWIDIMGVGGKPGQITYFGANNTACFSVIGLKGARFERVNVAIASGRTGCVIWDIDTTVAAGSTSFNTFKDMYLNLGGSADAGTAALRNEDCIGIRTGFAQLGAGDISNYNFENICVFGGGQSLNTTPNTVSLGQYAFQNVGPNTLSQAWFGGFVNGCDRAYSGITRDGTKRGNGCANFYGLGGSRNNIDFVFSWEQTYTISGGRWEVGNQFMVVNAGAFASFIITGTSIHAYKVEPWISIVNPCSLSLDSVQMNSGIGTNGVYYTNLISINTSAGRNGILRIVNSGFEQNTTFPYTKSGSDQWKMTMSGNVKMDGVWQVGFFNDETNALH